MNRPKRRTSQRMVDTEERRETRLLRPRVSRNETIRDRNRFKHAARKERRRIAKRHRFYRDKSGETWRQANKMVRGDGEDVQDL